MLISKRKYYLSPWPFLGGFCIFAFHGIFLNKVNTLGQHFSYLGSNFSEAGSIIIHRPWIVMGQLFRKENLEYFLKILPTGGGFWLLSGAGVVTFLPTLFQHMLSTNVGVRNLNNHYVLSLAAPLFFCTAYGLKTLFVEFKSLSASFKQRLIWMGFFFTLSFVSFSEVYEAKVILNSEGWAKRDCYSSIAANIPLEAPVLATDPFTGHLAEREKLLIYGNDLPNPIPKGFYVVARSSVPVQGTLIESLWIQSRCNHEVGLYFLLEVQVTSVNPSPDFSWETRVLPFNVNSSPKEPSNIFSLAEP